MPEQTGSPSAPRGALPTSLAVGEAALASSVLFRIHGLRLYRRDGPGAGQTRYLIGTAEAPVLPMELVSDGPSHPAATRDRRPLFLLSRRDMLYGRVGPVLRHLQNTLRDGRSLAGHPASWIEPIPLRDHARLAELHMIRPRVGYLWKPTPYGRSLGIVEAWLPPDQEGGRPRHTFCLLSSHRKELEAALAWSRTPAETSRARLPWAQTLERARQGLPRSDSHAVNVVRAFGAMSLDDYMAAYPAALAELRGQLQLSGTATYQEAAGRLYRYCTGLDPADEDFSDVCADLIFTFMQPVWDALHTIQPPIY